MAKLVNILMVMNKGRLEIMGVLERSSRKMQID